MYRQCRQKDWRRTMLWRHGELLLDDRNDAPARLAAHSRPGLAGLFLLRAVAKHFFGAVDQQPQMIAADPKAQADFAPVLFFQKSCLQNSADIRVQAAQQSLDIPCGLTGYHPIIRAGCVRGQIELRLHLHQPSLLAIGLAQHVIANSQHKNLKTLRLAHTLLRAEKCQHTQKRLLAQVACLVH